MEDALITVTGRQLHDRCVLDRRPRPVDVVQLPNRAKRKICGPIQSAVGLRTRSTAGCDNAFEEDAAKMYKQEQRNKPEGLVRLLGALMLSGVVLSAADTIPATTPTNQAGRAEVATNSVHAAAVSKLKFPGVSINLEERCVDVEATVCLHRGLLELVACTKGTKEHESIVAIDARPMHIHAALLLLGAKPGSPATRRQLGDQPERWIDVPPRGGPVDVYLVFKDKEGTMVERPISDFIAPTDKRSDDLVSADKEARFQTHTFLFAGSVLYGDGPGPRRYLSEESGNVISLSTFGDELLCLPGIHSQDNNALMWQVNAAGLPDVGSKVTLRLRPQVRPAAKTATTSLSYPARLCRSPCITGTRGGETRWQI